MPAWICRGLVLKRRGGVRGLNAPEFERLKTNGLRVQYYLVCKRKLWLYARQIRFERASERVQLGRLLHDEAYRRERREVMIDDLIRVDVLEGDGVILEVKYSRRLGSVHEAQLLYYLYYLKRRGAANLRGVLAYPRQKRRVEVALTPDKEAAIEEILRDIAHVEALTLPPEARQTRLCKACAFEAYCWG